MQRHHPLGVGASAARRPVSLTLVLKVSVCMRGRCLPPALLTGQGEGSMGWCLMSLNQSHPVWPAVEAGPPAPSAAGKGKSDSMLGLFLLLESWYLLPVNH